MKRAKSAETLAGRRWRPSHAIVAAAALYLVVISLKYRHFFEIAAGDSGDAYEHGGFHRKLEVSPKEESPPRTPEADPLIARARPWTTTGAVNSPSGYGRITGEILKRYRESRGRNWTRSGNFSELEKMATEAWALGRKAWEEAKSYNDAGGDLNPVVEGKSDACPSSVSIPSGGESEHDGEKLLFLPCGLAVGSSITVIGTPHSAHKEYVPELAKLEGDGTVMVAQFMVELRGLKAVDGEDPPKILHLNPRLKGDWSKKPVIELNTCYRMQWGKAMRCDGLPSLGFDDIVDGFLRCEKWERSDIVDSKESKTTSWLQRFIGRAKKPEMTWPFPFVEGRLFVLTVQAGVEGYHIIVGGRHVSSFPYRTGFTLEDATGLAVKGNVDIHSIYATSLPRTHPSFSLQQVLEMSENWKARPLLPEEPVQLFIGILSATNHFAERMAIRKTWMQYPALQLGNVVARFFVALGPRKEVNAAVKKEAEYFGDMMIMPFLDRYELVVLKTIAICEFGVHNLTADYIMKCDDDTFVRVDVVLKEINAISRTRSLYMGNLNLLHRPLRSGKWAVTQEEWPEDVYPPYANGPGYVISSDIARYIVSQRANQSLRMFKMEDVSMGMWVEDFNSSANVQYSHSWKFCQYGCLENYYTAHYQSPRQMICLWDKLSRGRAQCCNFR